MEGVSGGIPMAQGVSVPVSVQRSEAAPQMPKFSRQESVSAPKDRAGFRAQADVKQGLEGVRPVSDYADMIVEAAKVEGVDGAFRRLAEGKFDAESAAKSDVPVSGKKDLQENKFKDPVERVNFTDRLAATLAADKNLMQKLAEIRGEDGQIDYYRLLDMVNQEIEEQKKTEQGSIPLILLILKEFIIGTFKETDDVVGLRSHAR